jgi:hypothetical protein
VSGEQSSAWNLLWLLAPVLGVTLVAVAITRLAARDGRPVSRGGRARVIVMASIVFGGLWVGLGLFAEAEATGDIRVREPGFPTLHLETHRFLLVQSAVMLVVAAVAALALVRNLMEPGAGKRKAVLLGLPVAVVSGPLIGGAVALATVAKISPVTVTGERQQFTAYVEVEPSGLDTASQLATCLRRAGATADGSVRRSGTTYRLRFIANSAQQSAFDDCVSDLDGMQSVTYNFGL